MLNKYQDYNRELMKKHKCNAQDHKQIFTTAVIFPLNDCCPDYMRTVHVDLETFDLYISVHLFKEETLKYMKDMNFKSFRTNESVYAELNAFRQACEELNEVQGIKILDIIETRIINDVGFSNLYKKLRDKFQKDKASGDINFADQYESHESRADNGNA